MNQATKAVIDFLAEVDMEAWRANAPTTGDRDKDIQTVRKDVSTFARQGLNQGALLTKHTDRGAYVTRELASDLVNTALADVDWNAVVALWDNASLSTKEVKS